MWGASRKVIRKKSARLRKFRIPYFIIGYVDDYLSRLAGGWRITLQQRRRSIARRKLRFQSQEPDVNLMTSPNGKHDNMRSDLFQPAE